MASIRINKSILQRALERDGGPVQDTSAASSIDQSVLSQSGQSTVTKDEANLTGRISPLKLRRPGRRPLSFMGAAIVTLTVQPAMDLPVRHELEVYETKTGQFVARLLQRWASEDLKVIDVWVGNTLLDLAREIEETNADTLVSIYRLEHFVRDSEGEEELHGLGHSSRLTDIAHAIREEVKQLIGAMIAPDTNRAAS